MIISFRLLNKNVVFRIEMGNVIFFRYITQLLWGWRHVQTFKKYLGPIVFQFSKKKSRTLLESSHIWTEINID